MAEIVVTRNLPEEILAPLHEVGETWVWGDDRPIPREALLEAVRDARGLLCMLTDPIDHAVLDAAPQLEVVSQMAVGVDNIDVAACHRRGLKVGHTPGVLTETVADTAFALLAAIVRRIPEGERAVREGAWGPWSPFWLTGGDLHGMTLGIVGMGRVGSAVARRASGFGMEFVYSSPRSEGPGRKLGLDELLRVADAVVLCTRLTGETRGLVGRPQLQAMGEGSYLVNVARGEVVVTDDLVAALANGEIAGAALDVTDPEPLPPDHPLLGFPNCLVTPHIGSASEPTRRAMAELAVANLVAGLRGETMPAEVPWR
ncbi:MAG: D-glycerate dehydrogenase [Actinomycetes bacterium]